MFVIHELHKTYGVKLWDYRVLLLNAGGQSQRLPSASVLGKIFTALPTQPLYQVLDLKLALYLPFLERMKPGVFHAAADTIEVYDVGGRDEDWSFEKAGFTAAAHPSSLDIGVGHGVFVLENGTSGSREPKLVEFRPCLEVLQKPSVQRMREKGAVQIHPASHGEGEPQEFVYTDSFFFFDHGVSKKLMKFFMEDGPLECEIDSYGDFLQALGPRATKEYTKDVKNVATVESKLVETREKVFNLLKDTPLNIVLLNASKFYHLGTVRECLSHFCESPVLAKEVGFCSQTFSAFMTPLQTRTTKRARKDEKALTQGCIMHSALPDESVLSPTCIVEFCDFEVPLRVEDKSIVSSCVYNEDSLQMVVIPPETFIHTIAIQADNKAKFVTVIFGMNDNLKKKAHNKESVGSLPYFGKHLSDVASLWKLDLETLFARDQVLSLWYAKLFPASSTMSGSLELALKMLTAMHREETHDLSEYRTYSMSQLLMYKDITGMLRYRADLYRKISNAL